MAEPVMHIRLDQKSTEYRMLTYIQTPLTPRSPEQDITVEGLRLKLVAAPDGDPDSLIAFIPNTNPARNEMLQAEAICLRTLSALVWKYQRPFAQYLGFGGSPVLAWRPAMRPAQPRAGFYDFDDLQHPASSDARRAMAFYRQGLTQADPFFQFLGFYRVIELLAGEGRKPQVAWINSNVPAVQKGEAGARARELQSAGEDVGEYLYVSCRSAIAHSGFDPAKPVADPDNPADLDRIIADRPLVQSLAKYAIRDIYDIPTEWGRL